MLNSAGAIETSYYSEHLETGPKIPLIGANFKFLNKRSEKLATVETQDHVIVRFAFEPLQIRIPDYVYTQILATNH